MAKLVVNLCCKVRGTACLMAATSLYLLQRESAFAIPGLKSREIS